METRHTESVVRWSVDALVIWDNRCTCHVALADFEQTKPRVMYRCSLEGEQKTGRILAAAVAGDWTSMLQAVAAVS